MDSDEFENPLKAGLDAAFTNPPSILSPAAQAHPSTTGTSALPAVAAPASSPTPPGLPSLEGSGSPGAVDEWKSELDQLTVTWHNKSAAARERAESNRASWEAVRAAQEDAIEMKATLPVSSDTACSIIAPITPASSSSTAIASFSIPHSHSEKLTASPPTNVESSTEFLRTHSVRSITDSQKWVEVYSGTSSLPSLSFPEPSGTPSRSRHIEPQPTSLSATLTIFDSSLSVQTRFNAFLSSLTINVLLPFVNGVMLGFGEIFAKNFILARLGWDVSRPGSTVASIGIRKTHHT